MGVRESFCSLYRQLCEPGEAEELPGDYGVHEAPTSIAGRLEGRVEAGAGLVLARSAMTFSQGARRVGIFALREDAPPRPLEDVFVRVEDEEVLAEALAGAWSPLRGGWDAYFATSWSWVWASGDGGLRLWRRDAGLALRTDAGGVELEGGGRVARGEIERIELVVSEDWVLRRVQLVTVGGELHTIAEERDWIAQIDPTYDGIMLECDCAWLDRLGRDVAGVVEVSYEDRL
jgi:hypothetical protein